MSSGIDPKKILFIILGIGVLVNIYRISPYLFLITLVIIFFKKILPLMKGTDWEKIKTGKFIENERIRKIILDIFPFFLLCILLLGSQMVYEGIEYGYYRGGIPDYDRTEWISYTSSEKGYVLAATPETFFNEYEGNPNKMADIAAWAALTDDYNDRYLRVYKNTLLDLGERESPSAYNVKMSGSGRMQFIFKDKSGACPDTVISLHFNAPVSRSKGITVKHEDGIIEIDGEKYSYEGGSNMKDRTILRYIRFVPDNEKTMDIKVWGI